LTTHTFIPGFFYENSGLLPQTTQPFFSNLSKKRARWCNANGLFAWAAILFILFLFFLIFIQPGCRLPVGRKSGFFRTHKKGEEHFVFAWGSHISQH